MSGKDGMQGCRFQQKEGLFAGRSIKLAGCGGWLWRKRRLMLVRKGGAVRCGATFRRAFYLTAATCENLKASG